MAQEKERHGLICVYRICLDANTAFEFNGLSNWKRSHKCIPTIRLHFSPSQGYDCPYISPFFFFQNLEVNIRFHLFFYTSCWYFFFFLNICFVFFRSYFWNPTMPTQFLWFPLIFSNFYLISSSSTSRTNVLYHGAREVLKISA